jgi:hypothetical protein
MLLLFATIVGPIFFFLLAWVVATVYRLYFPERPLPFEKDPIVVRERATASGRSLPVGVREIRADQRRRNRQHEPQVEYEYRPWSGPESFPEEWREDLWLRRN